MPLRNRTLFAAFVAALILGWGTAGQAIASCGDYVMVNGEGHKPSQVEPPAPHHSQAPSLPKPRQRCSGPHCSSHQQPTPVPPAPPVTSYDKVAVSWIDIGLLDDRPSRRLFENRRLIFPNGASLDIFHPPRDL